VTAQRATPRAGRSRIDPDRLLQSEHGDVEGAADRALGDAAQLVLQAGRHADAAKAEPRRLPDRAAHQVGQPHQDAPAGFELLEDALQLAAR
jgi:hypothetical protein